MTARSYKRGWPIIFQNGNWIYKDTQESISNERACSLCGKLPTPEGFDFCIGEIKGAKSACCGHGVREPFILF